MAAGGWEGRGGGRGGCGPRGFAGRGAAPEGSPPHRAAALGLSAAPGVGQGSAFPPSLPFCLPAFPTHRRGCGRRQLPGAILLVRLRGPAGLGAATWRRGPRGSWLGWRDGRAFSLGPAGLLAGLAASCCEIPPTSRR